MNRIPDLAHRLDARAVQITLALALFGSACFGQHVIQEEQKLIDPSGGADAWFGYSVAADGDVLVVGAPQDPQFGSGSASVYRFDGSIWVLEQRLVLPTLPPDALFGASVAVSGTVVAVGAPKDHGIVARTGSVYVYRYDGLAWQLEQKILDPYGESDEYFGHSLALDGDRVAVGAPFDAWAPAPTPMGTVSTFTFDGTAWTVEQKIRESEIFFGQSLALQAEYLLVGTWNNAVHSFRHDGKKWVRHQILTATQRFGIAVAMEDEVAAIGEGVLVERRSANGWNKEQELTSPDPQKEAAFGSSVNIKGGVIVVGDYEHDTASREPDRGACYGYRYTGAQWPGARWPEVFELLASDGSDFDWLGFSVATNGLHVFAGAPMDDDVAKDAGSVYVGRLPPSRTR